MLEVVERRRRSHNPEVRRLNRMEYVGACRMTAKERPMIKNEFSMHEIEMKAGLRWRAIPLTLILSPNGGEETRRRVVLEIGEWLGEIFVGLNEVLAHGHNCGSYLQGQLLPHDRKGTANDQE